MPVDKVALNLRTLIAKRLHLLENQILEGNVITTQQAANVVACELEKYFNLELKPDTKETA